MKRDINPAASPYRRMVCTSYVEGDELDEDAQQVILGALERVAEGVRSKIISLRRLWTSELGDLLTLYVIVCKDQIAVERTNSPTFLEGILWCDRKLRRYTFVREAPSRVKRLGRRARFTKRHVVPDREITRLSKIEAALIPRPPSLNGHADLTTPLPNPAAVVPAPVIG